jgi:uncharacterized protein (DUF1697 family)
MQSYLALLRGINVGGNNMIKMAELKTCLEDAGFHNVRTYIQSGNVIFKAQDDDTAKLEKRMEEIIQERFGMQIRVAVFSKDEWSAILDNAPEKWGKEMDWKHNILVLLRPYTTDNAVAAIGELKPDIEMMIAGKGVLYQSASIKMVGRTTTGKLASNPIYKQMTIRNYNSATKLLALLQ